jgi:transketolase
MRGISGSGLPEGWVVAIGDPEASGSEEESMAVDAYTQLRSKATWARRKVLEMSVKAKSGHVSSAYSQMELLLALYQGGILRVDPRRPRWAGRDRFILSKGQGGIGLYPVLADAGFFPVSDLDNFAGRGSHLGVHAEWSVPGIEVLSGSLGHGLPIATGIAQVGMQDGADWLVVCLLGDSELYEGSNWEAAFYAGQKRLGNLICIVDRNQQGVLGFSDQVESPKDGPGLDPLDAKFAAFGFETRVIEDGHAFPQIFAALGDIRARHSKPPLAVIAQTIKGKGVSVMENQRLWHYRVPTGKELDIARAELRG